MTKLEPASAETISTATVLVVDDIPANRDLLRATLEPQGYELLPPPTANSAQSRPTRQPDVILSCEYARH
jgi:CheY-like chemotaxis protein